MTFKVAIPQDITEVGKEYLRTRGYELLIGDGRMDVESLSKLVKDADAILARTGQYPKEVLSAAKN